MVNVSYKTTGNQVPLIKKKKQLSIFNSKYIYVYISLLKDVLITILQRLVNPQPLTLPSYPPGTDTLRQRLREAWHLGSGLGTRGRPPSCRARSERHLLMFTEPSCIPVDSLLHVDRRSPCHHTWDEEQKEVLSSASKARRKPGSLGAERPPSTAPRQTIHLKEMLL